jgi:hypothetical protein
VAEDLLAADHLVHEEESELGGRCTAVPILLRDDKRNGGSRLGKRGIVLDLRVLLVLGVAPQELPEIFVDVHLGNCLSLLLLHKAEQSGLETFVVDISPCRMCRRDPSKSCCLLPFNEVQLGYARFIVFSLIGSRNSK